MLAAVLTAALAWMVGGAAPSSAFGNEGASPSASATRTARHETVVASTPVTVEAVAGDRNERLTEATQHDRRHSSRDGRPLDWIAVTGLAAIAVTALASAIARRRHRRIPSFACGFTPARAPPLLRPS
jgi:hypothetical protein